MSPHDLLKLNLCNLDHLTENYDLNFYYQYLMKWPSLFTVVEDHGQIVGYSMIPTIFCSNLLVPFRYPLSIPLFVLVRLLRSEAFSMEIPHFPFF